MIITSPRFGAGLSTPHGALGTMVKELKLIDKVALSTPHGALGTFIESRSEQNRTDLQKLSTPHGALGTSPAKKLKEV